MSLSRTADGVGIWQGMFRGRRTSRRPSGCDCFGHRRQASCKAAPGGGRRADQIATSPEVYALYSEARQLIRPASGSISRAPRRSCASRAEGSELCSVLVVAGAAIFFNGRIAIVDADARAEGMAAVRHALELAPELAPAHATLALLKGDNSPEAEAELRRAVALDPSYSEAWNWLGNSLSSQGRYRDAMASYERAVALDPLLSPAVANLH